MSVFNSLRRLDIYRAVPKDLTESSNTGALISLFSLIILAYLFISELIAFNTVELHSQMYVDPYAHVHASEAVSSYSGFNPAPTLQADIASTHATIGIRLNMTAPGMPCAVASLDVQDVMGGHILDYGGKLHRWRTDSKGNLLRDSMGNKLSWDSIDPVKQRGEGCNIEGSLLVKRVPGNFHLSAHAHGDLLDLFYDNEKGETLNCSHTIHELAFGLDDQLQKAVEQNLDLFRSFSGWSSGFGDSSSSTSSSLAIPVSFTPLNGRKQISEPKFTYSAVITEGHPVQKHDTFLPHDSPTLIGGTNSANSKDELELKQVHIPISYEYYIKVVPTKYAKLGVSLENSIEGYQIVASSNEIPGRMQMPAIYFRYDFSPITVLFEERKATFSYFLVEVCAIIGGVFTVLGMFSGVILAASKKYKSSINKLG
jgi:hypothetical protein